MRISVLDQSPVLEGFSPSHAIKATIELAVAAEQLGYNRFWLAEHHNMRGLANPCPEILLSAIGHHTKKMRIGTGGILLPYYSPLKVAETFNMLETLFPKRIDLGIGRAPGGDRLTANALNPNAFNDANAFPNQVVETLQWLDGSIPKQHPFGEIKAMPTSTISPEVWFLGHQITVAHSLRISVYPLPSHILFQRRVAKKLVSIQTKLYRDRNW